MCLVLSKLPGNSREKWNRTVLNIRMRHLREPDFADLIHFVDGEATLANDPLFSKDVLSGYVDQAFEHISGYCKREEREIKGGLLSLSK